MSDPSGVFRRPAHERETRFANRSWWDAAADSYQAEHAKFLGDARFIWGPEGLDEADARLLGPAGSLTGRRVLEVGCGAAQCSRWLDSEGALAVGIDLSAGQLRHARDVPVLQADASRLPFADATFDIACSAYGALPFVAEAGAVHREVARVLRPGGRWVFSVSHPIRWCLPDDPGEAGLVVTSSYFDRTPYLEVDDAGRATYVEHHRTIGDWVRQTTAAGLNLLDVVEPEWPDDLDETWGGWSPTRGRLIPGTAIFVTAKGSS